MASATEMTFYGSENKFNFWSTKCRNGCGPSLSLFSPLYCLQSVSLCQFIKLQQLECSLMRCHNKRQHAATVSPVSFSLAPPSLSFFLTLSSLLLHLSVSFSLSHFDETLLKTLMARRAEIYDPLSRSTLCSNPPSPRYLLDRQPL